MVNTDELREAVKRFCRTEKAADNLVKYIIQAQQQAVQTSSKALIEEMGAIIGEIELPPKPVISTIGNATISVSNYNSTSLSARNALRQTQREALEKIKLSLGEK